MRETLEAIKDAPCVVLGAAVIVDRSAGRADMGCELVALASIEVESFAADEIPDDLKGIPAIKPGSRALSQGASS